MNNSSKKENGFLKRKKGVALILAMFILVFVSILVVAFLWLVTSDLMITSNHLGRLRALYVAEAGAEYAISLLRASGNQAINTGSITFPNPGSSYTVTKPLNSRVIQSSGQVDNNSFQATLEVQVSIQGPGTPYQVRVVRYQETG